MKQGNQGTKYEISSNEPLSAMAPTTTHRQFPHAIRLRKKPGFIERGAGSTTMLCTEAIDATDPEGLAFRTNPEPDMENKRLIERSI